VALVLLGSEAQCDQLGVMYLKLLVDFSCIL
jgi:hypothetical protein